jgi:branched-chain amino acid aminotransferase
VVIHLARKEGISVREEVFTPADLYVSNECFLTGTAAEIIPVTQVDERVIGEGKVGEITKKLMSEFRQLTQTEGTPIYES